MSTITGPRSTTPIEKDDYSKKCHWIVHHYNCGHRKHSPRIFHVGCPHNPQNKKRCDNMASCARGVYFSEPCSECRPRAEVTGVMNTDPFDALLKRTGGNKQAQESIRNMAHLAFESVRLQENQDAATSKPKDYPQSALVQDKLLLAGGSPDNKKRMNFILSDEQLANGTENGIVESINSQPIESPGSAPRSLLSSVWTLMKMTRKAPIDPNQCDDDDWSDSDEDANWESMRNEDNQLWKDKEDDWVHVN